MLRRTHAMTGLAIGIGASAVLRLPLSSAIPLVFLCQVAAVLPDTDLKIGLQHRGLTHSLLAVGLWAVCVWYVFPSICHFPALLAFTSHLALDMLTVQGIRLLYPGRQRFRLLKLRTGSAADLGLCVCAGCAALVCLAALLGVN